MIDRVTHRDRDLNLPLFRACANNDVHQLGKLGNHFRANLRIHADVQAGFAGPPQSIEGLMERSGDATQLIVQRL